jgi:hypothetical protein
VGPVNALLGYCEIGAKLFRNRGTVEIAGVAGLLRGWPARWHVIWCKVNEFAGTALKYVVVFRGASVHRGAT